MTQKPAVTMLLTTPEGAMAAPDENVNKNSEKRSKKAKEDSTLLGAQDAKRNKVSEVQDSPTPPVASQQSSKSQVIPGKKRDSKTMTPTQLRDLKIAFTMFDTDHDGTIAPKELCYVMRALGQNPTDSEIRDILHDSDIDGNGRIDFNEFAAMMAIHMKTQKEMEDELRDAFKMFDTNKDGFISTTELCHMMHAMGEQVSPADLDAIIKQWDTDGDGRINYNVTSLV